MPLYDTLEQHDAVRVFILGMAKNAGKTFTLNHLVRAAAARGERLGLTSTGRDGESLDLVTGKAKPRIFCPEGTIVATSRMAMDASTASFGDVEHTGVDTVLGEVLVGEVSREGYVELAGPLFASELEAVVHLMSRRGARRGLVDGSLDRKAAGRVAPDLVLAVGAVLSRRLDEVVEKAAAFVDQLRMPEAPDWVRDVAREAFDAGALLYSDGAHKPLPFSTLMGRRKELARLIERERPWGVYASGAVGEETFLSLLESDPPAHLVVRGAFALFVDPADWRRFSARGGLCYAVEPLRLVAVTVNPYSPEGWELPADELLRALEEALSPLPVINPAKEPAE